MANFKQKLDDMMGDTSKQEQRLKEKVRANLVKPPKKRMWQIPVVASAATAIAIFLFSSVGGFHVFTSNEGKGVPYDPLDDFYEISTLKAAGDLSAMDFQQFTGLPTVQQLEPLQYLDPRTIDIAGEVYYPVIERKERIYDEAVYEAGDIVRAVNNARNHLPIFEDEYYEVVAGPGDRIVLEDGDLKVNGKVVNSELLKKYEQLDVKLVGGYDQLLNMREYLLLNYFPARGTVQAAAINPVHKIYGELVALAAADEVQSIYVEQDATTDYGAAQYFDLYLYDMIFGTGDIAVTLTDNGAQLSDVSKIEEFYLEAGYREVVNQTENTATLRYDYGREGGNVYEFSMRKVPGTTIWRWDRP